MTVYSLFLESGPQHKKTMVHVPALLGCVATGRTTEEALERTPDAIRAFLHFLHRHGDDVDPDQPIVPDVVEHVTQGEWLGDGSPYLVFTSDLKPLSPDEVEPLITRAGWMRAELLALVQDLSDDAWADKPETGRTIRRILEHVAGAEYNFVRLFGKIPGLAGPGATEKMGRDEFLAWIDHVQQCEFDRLRTLTEAERNEPLDRGQTTRTARKVLRRLLEHQWEHLTELRNRLTETP